MDGNQDFGFLTLYGKDGAQPTSNQCGSNDLAAVINNDSYLTTTSRPLFGSAVMDLTFTNMSTVTEGGGVQNTGCEVDVYDIVYRIKTEHASPILLFQSGDSNTVQINTSQPSLSLHQRGTTPFDIPDALSQAGIKILKKTKFLLGVGECATYQIRDSKNRKFRSDVVNDNEDNFIYPGATRSLLIIAKGVPTTNSQYQHMILNIGCTRKYMYKVIKQDINADNFLP